MNIALKYRHIKRVAFVTLLLACCGCKTELHTSLNEQDANEMLAKLVINGIDAKKQRDKEGITLLVEERQFGEAVELLAALGLPKRRFSTVGDVFVAEGLVASPLQEWARLNFARSQELSKSISTIPGVVKADVHLGEARKESPFEEAEPPSASVLIQINENLISDDIIPQIKQLVALAHPEITYDRVGVMLTPVRQQEVVMPVQNVAGLLVHENSLPAVRILMIVAALTGLASLLTSAFAFIQWRKRLGAAAQ